MNPNSFDKEIKDAQANPESNNQGTEGENTPANPPVEGEPQVDYSKKFAESSKEALRLYEENKKLQAELEARANAPVEMPTKVTENLYPGFEQLDADAQANLVAYTNLIEKRALEGVYKDPAIKFAKEQYNTTKWESAFNQVVEKFPDLKESKDEFRKKYFKADVVPDNISTILEDVAKIHLFDKAKELGAAEEKQKAARVELERATGGDKTPQVSRTLSDWMRMSQENPAKFAQSAKEFNSDMASGKLKE
jgi:hypothetical protein